jgi:hypothetical protein
MLRKNAKLRDRTVHAEDKAVLPAFEITPFEAEMLIALLKEAGHGYLDWTEVDGKGTRKSRRTTGRFTPSDDRPFGARTTDDWGQ